MRTQPSPSTSSRTKSGGRTARVLRAAIGIPVALALVGGVLPVTAEVAEAAPALNQVASVSMNTQALGSAQLLTAARKSSKPARKKARKPARKKVRKPVAKKAAKPVRKKARKPVTKPAPSRTDPRFSTCKAANAAGYGPYIRGVDREYTWYFDRDKDGIVCERR